MFANSCHLELHILDPSENVWMGGVDFICENFHSKILVWGIAAIILHPKILVCYCSWLHT